MMSRLLRCFVLVLAVAGCVAEPKVYFKNPIFYEPMYSNNQTYYDKVITPVAMVHFHNEEVLPAKCTVLSDVGYQITMVCRHPPYRVTPETTRYYRFTNAGETKFLTNTCGIRGETFFEDEVDLKTPSIISWYTIHKKEGEDCGQISPESILPELFQP